jgi:hypothetical protein
MKGGKVEKGRHHIYRLISRLKCEQQHEAKRKMERERGRQLHGCLCSSSPRHMDCTVHYTLVLVAAARVG